MKTQHTPGPWNKDEQGDANGNFTIRPDDGSTNGDTHAEVIATVYTEEDARLIAAAPELLEACAAFDKALTREELEYALQLTKIAIQKAFGRPSQANQV